MLVGPGRGRPHRRRRHPLASAPTPLTARPADRASVVRRVQRPGVFTRVEPTIGTRCRERGLPGHPLGRRRHRRRDRLVVAQPVVERPGVIANRTWDWRHRRNDITPPVAPPRRWPPAGVSGRCLAPGPFGPAAAFSRFRPVRLPACLTTACLTTACLTTGRTGAALAQVLDPVVVLVLVLACRVIPGRQPIVAVGPTFTHATRFP